MHWMRWNLPPTAWAIVWAAVVLARPGTLSRSTWPPVSSAMSNVSCRRACPTTFAANVVEIASTVSLAQWSSSDVR